MNLNYSWRDLNEAIKWEAEAHSNNPSGGPLLHSGRVCRGSFVITPLRFDKNGPWNGVIYIELAQNNNNDNKKTWLGTLLTRVSLGKNFTKPSRAHVRTVHSVNAQSLKHIQAYSWEVGGKWDQIQREITDWGQWIDGWLEAPWNPWVMVLHLIAFCVCLNYAT